MFLPEIFPEEGLLSEENIAEMKFTTRVQKILPKDFQVSDIRESMAMYFNGVMGGQILSSRNMNIQKDDEQSGDEENQEDDISQQSDDEDQEKSEEEPVVVPKRRR